MVLREGRAKTELQANIETIHRRRYKISFEISHTAELPDWTISK